MTQTVFISCLPQTVLHCLGIVRDRARGPKEKRTQASGPPPGLNKQNINMMPFFLLCTFNLPETAPRCKKCWCIFETTFRHYSKRVHVAAILEAFLKTTTTKSKQKISIYSFVCRVSAT